MGPRRHRRQALHPAGAPGNREIARRGWSQPAPLCDQRREKSVVRRSRHRPKSRPRQSAPGERRLGNGHRKSGRYFGYRHDRPRLGAGDEARFGNCDQPRRPHLPRRHYCARAGHSGRGGLRRCHQRAFRGTGSYRVVRRRRHRLDLRRLAGCGSDRCGFG